MLWPRRPYRQRPVLPAHRWAGQSRSARFWRGLKPWLLTGLLIAASWYLARWWGDPAPEPPRADSELVSGRFTRCGMGAAANCVVDGDTIVVGARKIRVLGIDAPELHPSRCPAEAQLGEAAARQLLALVNQGPFHLTGPAAPVRDEYGRELHNLVRLRSDGSVQSIADDMVASKTVRVYLHGSRAGWC